MVATHISSLQFHCFYHSEVPLPPKEGVVPSPVSIPSEQQQQQAAPYMSRWARNLKTNSPRRMRPRITEHSDKAPRFRRMQAPEGAPAFNFSFACGGWLQFYEFGCAKCLCDHGLHAVAEKQKFIGSSAGGICALGMGLDGE